MSPFLPTSMRVILSRSGLLSNLRRVPKTLVRVLFIVPLCNRRKLVSVLVKFCVRLLCLIRGAVLSLAIGSGGLVTRIIRLNVELVDVYILCSIAEDRVLSVSGTTGISGVGFVLVLL